MEVPEVDPRLPLGEFTVTCPADGTETRVELAADLTHAPPRPIVVSCEWFAGPVTCSQGCVDRDARLEPGTTQGMDHADGQDRGDRAPPGAVTVAQLAKALSVDVGEVLDLVISGQLPPTGPGGLWWPDRGELDPWLVELVNRDVR